MPSTFPVYFIKTSRNNYENNTSMFSDMYKNVCNTLKNNLVESSFRNSLLINWND